MFLYSTQVTCPCWPGSCW